MTFYAWVPIHPVAKGRPRFTRSGHAYTPDKTRKFESEVARYLKARCKHVTEGPLRVEVILFLKKPKTSKNKHPIVKPDSTNFIKGIEDAANGILWRDDSQIIDLRVIKRYHTPLEAGGFSIQVWSVE